jgi:hypothetical protein
MIVSFLNAHISKDNSDLNISIDSLSDIVNVEDIEDESRHESKRLKDDIYRIKIALDYFKSPSDLLKALLVLCQCILMSTFITFSLTLKFMNLCRTQ